MEETYPSPPQASRKKADLNKKNEQDNNKTVQIRDPCGLKRNILSNHKFPKE